MSRSVRWLPWFLVTSAVALMAAAEVVAIHSGSAYEGSGPVIWVVALVFGSTGVLIASRHRSNPIGWLFLTASVAAGLASLTGAYADYYVQERRGSELLARLAAEYGELAWMPFIVLPATFLLMLFPTGHLLSARWRPVAWCAGVGIGGNFVVTAMIAGPIPRRPTLTNPFGVDLPIIDPLNGFTLLLAAIGLVGAGISLIVRFRRSHGEERDQIKWLALAGSVAVFTIVLGILEYDRLGERLANIVIMVAVMGLPVAAAIAIMRYRLYDIDVVINRALVYGSLTGTLATTYVGTVLLMQFALTGITQGSGLAVAASTLAAAVVFRPARARIQQVVDRRFFRSRYDAALIVESFGARLRDDVDLGTITSDLLEAVRTTVQPAHVSLWMRPDTHSG